MFFTIRVIYYFGNLLNDDELINTEKAKVKKIRYVHWENKIVNITLYSRQIYYIQHVTGPYV